MAGLQSCNADGSAYGRPPQHIDEGLARVGPGMPWASCFVAFGIRLPRPTR